MGHHAATLLTSPAIVEDRLLGLAHAICAALMAQQGMREAAAYGIAIAVLNDLRVTYAGQAVEFPPLQPEPAAN